MDLQDRYDTALSLLQRKFNLKLGAISDRLTKKKIPNGSMGRLSSAKSKVNPETGYKIGNGELKGFRLSRLVEEMEKWLAEKDIVLSEDGNHYVNLISNKYYESIYNGKLDIKSPKYGNGLLYIHDKLPRKQLQEGIKRAKSVRILQSFMTSIEDYVESFKECLKRGGKISILLMNPSGMAAKIRTRSFLDKDLKVEQKVIENIKMLEEISPSKGSIEIKLYDEFPGVDLIAIDDKMYCGWYLFKQLAMNGGYLEFINNNNFLLPKKFNRNWDELWSRSDPVEYGWRKSVLSGEQFRCHYIREGNYRTFDVLINKTTAEVLITNTVSKEEFRGHLENDRGRFLSIFVETINKFEEGKLIEINKRILSFLIYTEANGICFQGLSIGVMINVTHSGLLRANRVLIENLKIEDRSTESGGKTRTRVSDIKRFLLDSEVKAEDMPHHSFEGLHEYLKGKYTSWYEQQERMPLLEGGFHLYYSGLDEKSQACICRRPLKLIASEAKAERDIWLEQRKRLYTLKVPDRRNVILITSEEKISDFEVILLRRTGPSWNRFKGELLFINSQNESKLTKAFAIRNEKELRDTDFTLYKESDEFKELCKYPDFGEYFCTED